MRPDPGIVAIAALAMMAVSGAQNQAPAANTVPATAEPRADAMIAETEAGHKPK